MENRKNILLIEDDEIQKRLIEIALLGDSGPQEFRLESVKRLSEGFMRLEQGGIDLVLLDLNLPDSEGIETFLKIHHQMPDVPVVILSAFNNDAFAREAIRKGAQDYLFKKETHPELLLRTIRYAIERNRLQTEIHQANARLERLALIDPVTELLNRRGLQEILVHEIQRARRKQSNLLALLIGLDNFKRINQTLGHTVGDVVLKEVAAKLREALRATDYAGRLAGDEFLILLPETRLAEGMRVAEKVRLAISMTSISLSPRESIQVTASLGLVNVGFVSGFEAIPSLDELLAKTQFVLHQSKNAGRNRVSYESSGSSVDGIDLDAPFDFSAALRKSDPFHTLMQPIFRLSDQSEIFGYELLSRSGVKGFEMPDDFFRASLEANILTAVDRECLKTCVNASSLLPAGLQYHVNLFPSTMISVPVQHILEVFEASASKMSYCIEISEQQIIGDPSYLAETVNFLKRSGILIALDDLGFGRSCLESLILLEPDIVKIDKRCVSGIAADGAPIRSLKRLLKIAKSLGAEVVAEGIETRDELEILKQLGVKYGQGFFLGKPIHAVAAKNLV